MSYWKAIGMGAVAGMRCMAAAALVSERLANARGEPLQDSPLHFLANPGVAAGLKALAAGEMVADKTPWIPDRTSPPALGGRILVGALVGAALCSRKDYRPEVGALLGVAGAVASTYGMYHLRRDLGKELNIPDPLLAVGEDFAVCIAGGKLLDDVSWDEVRPLGEG